jgi:hypothetical protein
MSGLIAGAIIGGVAGNKSANIQADAATNASNTQAASADKATQLQREMFLAQQQNQKPFQEAGVNALGQLALQPKQQNFNYTPQSFDYNQNADPGYAFRLSEGMKALQGNASQRGGLMSGNTMRAAIGYGQDMGSQEYQNAYNRYQSNNTNQFNQQLAAYNANENATGANYNRLASLAGVGQTATQQIGNAGQTYANNAGNINMTSGANMGNAQLAAGNANASAYQGYGNALGTAAQQLGKINWNPTSSVMPSAANNSMGFDLNNPYGYQVTPFGP